MNCICTTCGYNYEGSSAPTECPNCHEKTWTFAPEASTPDAAADSVDNLDNYSYQPLVPADSVSQLDRQGTMDVLKVVAEIAKESENYDLEIANLTKSISAETAQAEKLRQQYSTIASVIIWGVAIFAAFIGSMIIPVLMTVIFGVVALIIMFMTVGKADLKKHEAENNAKADAYLREHVLPQQERLDSVSALREELHNSGKLAWALDVVGKDLFFSACINDLYELIKTRRADSLKEALNKYDDEQHKAHMEEMQAAIQNASEVTAAETAKQTAYSKQIAKSTHQAATASKATAYHTRQISKNAGKISKNTKSLRR